MPENTKSAAYTDCAQRHFAADFYPRKETKCTADNDSNAVGYTSGTVVKAKYTPLPIAFQAIDKDGKIAIKDIVVEKNPGTADSASKSSADKLLVWNGNGYDTYFLNKSSKWCKADETTETTNTVDVGSAVFYQKGSLKNGEYTMSGSVYLGDSVTVTLKKSKYAFVANPWPVKISVASVGALITNPGTADSPTKSSADKIMLWNGNGYDTYYNDKNHGWCLAGETEETKQEIEVGQGFFIQKGSLKDGTITFTKPTGL